MGGFTGLAGSRLPELLNWVGEAVAVVVAATVAAADAAAVKVVVLAAAVLAAAADQVGLAQKEEEELPAVWRALLQGRPLKEHPLKEPQLVLRERLLGRILEACRVASVQALVLAPTLVWRVP